MKNYLVKNLSKYKNSVNKKKSLMQFSIHQDYPTDPCAVV
jgi:hypothetical protein